MNYQVFLLLHLVSVLLLSGVTFAALASGDPDQRRQYLMRSGILSLLVFISGFGVMGMMGLGFPGWAVVKVVCWLGLSGITGMAFRMRDKTSMLAAVATVLMLVAVIMVVYKPF